MFIKCALAVCLQVILIQGLSAQCIGPYNGLAAAEKLSWPAVNTLGRESPAPWGVTPSCAASAGYASPWAAAPFAEWEAGYSSATLAASNGGGFVVTCASPISPIGVSMTSENLYEGPLAVSGAMPFLGAVALEGVLPTGGAGAVTYGCGNGNVAMINEDYAAGYGYGGPVYGASVATPAYGYNGFSGPVPVEVGIAGPAFRAVGSRLGGCGCGSVY